MPSAEQEGYDGYCRDCDETKETQKYVSAVHAYCPDCGVMLWPSKEEYIQDIHASERWARQHGLGNELVADGGQPRAEESAGTVQGVDGVIQFRREFVAPIHAGEKTATVRYPHNEHDFQPGDVLEATLEGGEPFELLSVERVAVVRAIEAHEFLDVVGFEHNTTSASELIGNLNDVYSDVVLPSSFVRVLCFEVLEQ